MSKHKTALVLAGCALYLVGLGWVDCATGYELGLFAFYTAPVAVVAWNLGQYTGFLAAFIASVVWYMADRYAGDHYSSRFYAYWNTGMHFSSFLINAITFAKIKASLERRRHLEHSLAEARLRLEQMAELMAKTQKAEPPGCSDVQLHR